MVTKLNVELVDGLMPNEKVARFRNADGRLEEVAVPVQNIDQGKMVTSEIARDGDNVLLELPRESATGRWRTWVKASAVGG